MKKYIVILLLSGIIFSCKKYPDGPALSLSSKKSRVANSWVLTKAVEDGTDRTGDYQNAYKDFNIIMSKSGNYTMTYKFYSSIDYSETGTWTFNGDKTYVILDPNSNNNGSWSWKILRLTQKEWWVLDEDFNGKKLEIHFVPK
jgi:hypothetical protein